MKHALRNLVREKLFTLVAIATLAFGFGAVTLVFSVANAVLLKPLTYRDPARLYSLAESSPKFTAIFGLPRVTVNASHFLSWQKECAVCRQAALFQPNAFNLTGDGEPERVSGISTTWRLFDVLGVEPQLGRSFIEAEDQPNNNRYAVISDALWKRRFHADPDIVGKSISIYEEPYIVVGVLRPDSTFPKGEQLGSIFPLPPTVDIVTPFGLDWSKQRRVGNFNYLAMMRLPANVDPRRAEAQMTGLITDAAKDMGIELNAVLTPLQDQMTGNARPSLWLLLGAVATVLLIVCVNLGNLMWVRATNRGRESAIRSALGASRLDLFKPIATESLILAFVGGALGVVLAYAGVRVLINAVSIDVPRLDEVRVDLVTLMFAFVTSAVCGILCGVWPAWQLSRSHPIDTLCAGTRAMTASAAKLNARSWLVGFEVSLTTLLLIIASLLGVSFLRLMAQNRGFQVDHILTADISLAKNRYPSDQRRIQFYEQMLQKLRELSGVKGAALTSSLPLRGVSWGSMIAKEGETRPDFERPSAQYRFVSEKYFDVMGIGLLQGRLPTEADRDHKVAVVSLAAARKAWPNENAVGKRIRGSDKDTEYADVIGVVADVRGDSLEKAPPLMVYVPYWDGKYWQGEVWLTATFVVRTVQDPSTMANSFFTAARNVNAELPLTGVHTMRDIVNESVGLRSFRTLLAGIFAVSALLLAALGIYGVLSYGVAQRTKELGIRLALGAKRTDVTMMVLADGLKPVIVGLGAGVLGAIWAGSMLRNLLFNVTGHDPITIVGVAAFILLMSLMASWIPVRRASRVDPMIALHWE